MINSPHDLLPPTKGDVDTLQPIRNFDAVGGEWSALGPSRFTPGRDQVPNCAGRCLGLGTGLIGHGKNHPRCDSNPVTPVPKQVSIPPTLPRSPNL